MDKPHLHEDAQSFDRFRDGLQKVMVAPKSEVEKQLSDEIAQRKTERQTKQSTKKART